MELRCPDDGHVLARHAIDGRPIGSCRQCHGLWISGAASAETQLPPEQVPMESRRASAAGSAGAVTEPRQCPQCATRMRHERHAGLTVDRCAGCDSTWLDAGEFDAVRAALLPPASAPARRPVAGDWTAWEFLGETVMHLLPSLLDG